MRVYISGMGIVTSLGNGISNTRDAIQKSLRGIRPLTVFPTASNPTRATQRLSALDAEEAPDAVVMGVTTGGMLTTEYLLKSKASDPKMYRLHATGSVAEVIARRYRCPGPALTVSTACSSGAVALKIALEMLRTGSFRRVLAGGADSLCRLTYYGFNALQLIDPEGAHPLDANRRGMSVGEGAAMLLLVANDPDHAVAATPHPQGQGALAAMQAALLDAGVSVPDIDYINLHGTGTLDNDISEARAVNALFSRKKPLLPATGITYWPVPGLRCVKRTTGGC